VVESQLPGVQKHALEAGAAWTLAASPALVEGEVTVFRVADDGVASLRRWRGRAGRTRPIPAGHAMLAAARGLGVSLGV